MSKSNSRTYSRKKATKVMAETIEEISDVLAEHGFVRPMNLKVSIKNVDHRGGVVQLEFATSKGIERSRIER